MLWSQLLLLQLFEIHSSMHDESHVQFLLHLQALYHRPNLLLDQKCTYYRDNKYTFDLTKDLVDDIVLVSEGEIAHGIHHAYWNESQIVEGAGAVTIASLLHKKFKTKGSSIALMCGRNINIDKHFSLISAKY